MSVKIYHNPRCSKSRQTLALLREKNVEPEIIKYLETPPTQAELKETLDLLGKAPQEIIRFKDAAAKGLGISAKDERGRDEWISLMLENPAIIERPIVVTDGKAVMGRPPENVLDII